MSLRKRAEELGIRYFLVSFSDLFGVSRAKLVPAPLIDEVCETGAAFAGFAAWLDLSPADSDIFAIPDPTSFIQLPWKPEIGWLAADLWMNGQPLAQAPRQILRQSSARAADRGFELRTGVECEFFLLSADEWAVADSRDVQQKPCYDQQAMSRRIDLISQICDYLSTLGWEPYQNDHEDANGQFEINWKYSNALRTADQQTFFKYLVKCVAEQHGLRATFMPKPFSHLTGNGCHTHVSLWDTQTNANLFLDDNDNLGLSTLARNFLGGVLHSAEALCAIVTPTVNSYRRIGAPVTASGATWSPNTISYAGNNRTHMVRIPDPGRIELRLVDGSANAYLLAAAILEAGLDGIENNRDPGPPQATNAYHSEVAESETRYLPDTLLDALRHFESNDVLQCGLGEDFARSYLKLKRDEWSQYSSKVSAWEIEHTCDC